MRQYYLIVFDQDASVVTSQVDDSVLSAVDEGTVRVFNITNPSHITESNGTDGDWIEVDQK